MILGDQIGLKAHAWSSFGAEIRTAPMTHTLLVSRLAASRARREISNARGYADSPNLRRPAESRWRGRSHSPSNRPDRADRRSAPIAWFSLSARTTLGNGGNHSLHVRNRANIPASPLRPRSLERMEHAKLANGNGHKLPIGRSPSP